MSVTAADSRSVPQSGSVEGSGDSKGDAVREIECPTSTSAHRRSRPAENLATSLTRERCWSAADAPAWSKAADSGGGVWLISCAARYSRTDCMYTTLYQQVKARKTRAVASTTPQAGHAGCRARPAGRQSAATSAWRPDGETSNAGSPVPRTQRKLSCMHVHFCL